MNAESCRFVSWRCYLGIMSAPDRLGGRYELRDVLGKGGMGEVRDGWDTRLGRPVAVKLLRPELADNKDIRRRFEAEASLAATLNHPRVVSIYDCGEDQDVPYIVMERLSGRTLRDEIAAGRLPEGRVRKILLGVVEALQAAHEAGILHRDIKPGNILFADRDSVKVTDFGIAKTTDTDQTLTGHVLGTAAYLSPQRLSGQPASVADDLYALGIVGYECLAGLKPFADKNPIGLVRAVADGHAVPLASACPGVDPALVAVIEAAMAREPERRFSTARAMFDALQTRWVAPVVAPPSCPAPASTVPIPVTDYEQPTSVTQVLESQMPLFVPERADFIGRFKSSVADHTRFAALAGLIAALVIAVVVASVSFGGHASVPSPTTSTPASVAAKTTPGSIQPTLSQALNNLSKAVQP